MLRAGRWEWRVERPRWSRRTRGCCTPAAKLRGAPRRRRCSPRRSVLLGAEHDVVPARDAGPTVAAAAVAALTRVPPRRLGRGPVGRRGGGGRGPYGIVRPAGGRVPLDRRLNSRLT